MIYHKSYLYTGIFSFILIGLISTSMNVSAEKAFRKEQSKKIDLVAEGKKIFEEKGCVECHSNKQGDKSFKTGPNLFGLFQVPASTHQIQMANGTRTKIEADKTYLAKSLATPNADLAIQVIGTEKGKAYLPIMPKIKVSGPDRKLLLTYFQSLNVEGQSGPKHVWKKISSNTKKKSKSPYNNNLWVGKEATFSRSHMANVSTRTIHVGLPNQTNYSFDTKDFSLKTVWSGGFLDVTTERIHRGRGVNSLGKGAINWNISSLVTPLTSELKPINLSFKNWPKFKTVPELDKYRIEQDKTDFSMPYLDRVMQAKGKFLGIDHSNKALPALNFEIDKAKYYQAININKNGSLTYRFKVTENKGDIAFLINEKDNQVVNVSTGEISHGKKGQSIWKVAKKQAGNFSITLKVNNTPKVLASIKSLSNTKVPAYTHDKQKVVFQADVKTVLPAGYKAQSIMAPKDRFGRVQLFEPLGLDFAANGTAVIGSRTAGIWKIKDNNWHFFADGFQDLLGLHIEDEKGNAIVVAQKPELTRIKDIDSDGYADVYQTINDDWRFAGSYSEYVHGPVPDGKGGYFLNLNLGAAGSDTLGGSFMGTFGGYDGWLVNITKQGELVPWASGLRSPAGLGYGPNNTLLFTDNQGSFVGTSKMNIVHKGDYYGYPASLKDDEKHRGKNIDWREVNKNKALPEIYFPHTIVANSPGNPTYDSTAGKFGPFADQILVGDQTLSNISRVSLEEVNGQWQGVVIPFISNLKSGAMKLSFAPDNSLWVGQTGRGWYAKGGRYEALQRISWDGKTMPFEIKIVNLVKDGFNITFTDELSNNVLTAENIAVKSWYYQDTDVYGSPRYDLEERVINKVEQSSKGVTINIENMQPGLIYEIIVKGVKSKAGLKPTHDAAYYTLHKLK